MAEGTPEDKRPMIRAVAAAVGVVGFVLFFVTLDFGFFGALFRAVVAAAAVLVFLLWRGGLAPFTRLDMPTVPATFPAPVRSVPVDVPRPILKPASERPGAEAAGDGEGEEAGGAATPDVPAAKAAPKVRPSAPLPGEAELAQRKGSWRYEPPAAAPSGLGGPRGGVADDLKRIKGVGPKLEGLLNGLGIYHFDQVAAWTEAEVAWVDENLEGFRGRVSRDDWVAQARVLAAGDATASPPGPGGEG